MKKLVFAILQGLCANVNINAYCTELVQQRYNYSHSALAQIYNRVFYFLYATNDMY